MARRSCDLEHVRRRFPHPALVPGGLARLHGALPVGHAENTIYVALVDPLNPQIAEDLRFALGREIQVVVAPSSKVRDLISQHYGAEASTIEDVLAQLGENTEVTLDEVGDDQFNAQVVAQEANAAPIIRFVDLVLDKAVSARASDIHFEPFEHEFKIRYRVDGALYEMAPPPRHLALPVISRVKVMANLNIAERRLPQDGRIMKSVDGNARSTCASPRCRRSSAKASCSACWTDRRVNLDLETLGMPDYIYDYILETIEKPNGIFIVTGSDRLRQDHHALRLPATRSTPSTPSCSPPRIRWNTTSTASCRCRSTKPSA